MFFCWLVKICYNFSDLGCNASKENGCPYYFLVVFSAFFFFFFFAILCDCTNLSWPSKKAWANNIKRACTQYNLRVRFLLCSFFYPYSFDNGLVVNIYIPCTSHYGVAPSSFHKPFFRRRHINWDVFFQRQIWRSSTPRLSGSWCAGRWRYVLDLLIGVPATAYTGTWFRHLFGLSVTIL